MPNLCACCAKRSDRDVHFKIGEIRIPFCKTCFEHTNLLYNKGYGLSDLCWCLIGTAFVALILGGILIQLELEKYAKLIMFIVISIGVLRGIILWGRGQHIRKKAIARMNESCCSPDQAVSYEGYEAGKHRFVFLNQAYALAFAEANNSQVQEIKRKK